MELCFIHYTLEDIVLSCVKTQGRDLHYITALYKIEKRLTLPPQLPQIWQSNTYIHSDM